MTIGTDTRGQTLHDFAIGMAVFLLVLGYVFAFLPSVFAPFTPSTDSTAIRVDRTADYLTRDLLVEGDDAGHLNLTCTRYFLNGSAPDGCHRLSQPVTSSTAHDLAALPPGTTLNVTLVREGAIGRYPPGSGDRLAFGPPVGEADGRVIRAVRIVTFGERDYQFVVRMW